MLMVSSRSAELLRGPGPGGTVRAEHGSRSQVPRGCSQVPLVPCPGRRRQRSLLCRGTEGAPVRSLRAAISAAVPLPRCTFRPCGTTATHSRLLSGRRESAGQTRAAHRSRGGGRGGAGIPGEGAAPLCNAVPPLQRSPRVSGAAGARRERPPRPALRSAPAAPRSAPRNNFCEWDRSGPWRHRRAPPAPNGGAGPVGRPARWLAGGRARAPTQAAAAAGIKGGGGQCVTPRIGGDTGTAPAPPPALRTLGKRRARRVSAGDRAGLWYLPSCARVRGAARAEAGEDGPSPLGHFLAPPLRRGVTGQDKVLRQRSRPGRPGEGGS